MYFATPFVFPLAQTLVQYFPDPLLCALVALVAMALSCEHFAVNRQLQVVFFRSKVKLITGQMTSVCQNS
jgi:hypothetical protein